MLNEAQQDQLIKIRSMIEKADEALISAVNVVKLLLNEVEICAKREVDGVDGCDPTFKAADIEMMMGHVTRHLFGINDLTLVNVRFGQILVMMSLKK